MADDDDDEAMHCGGGEVVVIFHLFVMICAMVAYDMLCYSNAYATTCLSLYYAVLIMVLSSVVWSFSRLFCYGRVLSHSDYRKETKRRNNVFISALKKE